MKSPKAPTAPDPVVTAGAQTGSNVSTAIANARLNQVNQVTPYGNLTYAQTGSTAFKDPTTGKSFDIPQFTATQTLSPQQQAIQGQSDAADLNMASIANTQSNFLKDYLGRGIDVSSLPAGGNLNGITTSLSSAGPIHDAIGRNPGAIQTGIGKTNRGVDYDVGATSGSTQYGFGDAGEVARSYNTDFSNDRQRVEDALMARLQPSLQQDRAALETQMSNQGIKLGSTAFDRGMDQFTRQSTDARLGAILSAGQEQSRLVGLEAQRAGFQNAAQQQTFDQMAGRVSLNNAAQAQEYGQRANDITIRNAAQAQEYGQRASDAAFSNAAQDQQYSQLSNDAAFANAAQAQRFGQGVTSAGFTNSVLSQQAAFANEARDRALQEQFALRNQPINEITSLLNGAQMQSPNFVNTGGSSIPTVDYAGLVQSNYQNQLGVYNQQAASRSQMLGGILGVAGQFAGAM